MQLDFDDAKRAPVRWEETVSIDAESLEAPEVDGLGPIETHGVFAFADPAFRLSGDLEYQQRLVCHRCLEAFDAPASERFEYLIERVSENGGPGGEEVQLEDEDLEVIRVSGDGVELQRILREQILLSLPMKPLCRNDCKGLCSECGGNRNNDSCGCKTKSVDPRWAGLEALKGNGK